MSNQMNPAEDTAEILIVEDSPTQAERLRYLLEQQRYRVAVAYNGQQALALLGKRKPTLVISDIIMPEMNGYALCQRIKVDERTWDIPVILLTSLSDTEDVLEGLACGADSFITKPYSEDYLLSHVAQILANTSLLPKSERARVGTEILFAGKRRLITADQQQMLTLLISTYEAAVHRNSELVQAQDELSSLTEHLEDLVEERTAALSAEIAERKQAQEALLKLGKAVDTSGEVIFMTDCEGVITFVNPEFTRLYGYTVAEVVGKTTPRLLKSGLMKPEDYTFFWQTILSKQVVKGELVNKAKDGRMLAIEGSASPILGEREEIVGFLAIQRDITVRKQAEEQIRHQLQRLAALREIDIAIIGSIDLQVTLQVILERVIAQLGVDAADVLLLNPHTQTLEYVIGRGFRTDSLRHTRLRLGDGLAGRAALERRVVHVPNLSQEKNSLERAPCLDREGFVTYHAVPLIAKGQVEGVLEVFHRVPFTPDDDWLDFIETLAGQAAIALDNARLFSGLQRANDELILAYDTTIEGWSRALDLRDKETEGHTLRSTERTLRLARAMGMGEAELVHVRRGALLHDIGKMGVPDSILLKPGPLSDGEWVVMRQHPVYAYDLLSPIAYLRDALDIPYYHHEKWDGTGYPRGLKGEGIPLAARIFAVVDVWDALISDRPYRLAWPEEKARAYIQEQAGKHFDPQVVDAFLREMAAE